MRPARALLLVGSAKVDGCSTSASLGRYLFDRLETLGVATTTMTVNCGIRGSDARLLAAVGDTDLLVVSTPVYIDSLPFLLVRAMESIAAARGRRPTPPSALAAIVNCGFPETTHCDTAIAILRLFARRARFEWAGGLALGEGGAIGGRRLDELGGFVRHVRAALDLSAAALADGRPVPGEAVARMARRLMPSRFYTFAGNIDWTRRAARNGVSRRNLRARPYAP